MGAATDLQLAATPAFGHQRPDLPWLLQTLPDVWQELDKQQLLQQCALTTLEPVIAAADRLLLQQEVGASVEKLSGTNSSQATEAAQLLDAICAILAGSSSSKGTQQLSYKAVLQPLMSQVLSLLQKHPELPPLQHLLPALSAVVSAGVAAGDSSSLEAAEQLLVDSKQAGSWDVSQLHWAAVAGAATAVTADTATTAQAPSSRQLLLQYWAKAVSSTSADETVSSAAATAAAEAVVAALAVDASDKGDLTQQLLTQPLPTGVLAALLQAASAPCGRVQRLLVAYALQRKEQLQELPVTLLAQLLPEAISAYAFTASAPSTAGRSAAAAVPAAEAVNFADCLQLLQVLLLHGEAALEAETAHQLSAALSISADNMQQLEQLVEQNAATDATAGLLCSLLQAASGTEQNWELFLLLQRCRAPSSSKGQQQLVRACEALLVKLDQYGTAVVPAAATAADRSVQVWQY